MPHRIAWEPSLATGHADTDAQHQALLALCEKLADQCALEGSAFDDTLAQFKAMAHAHLAAEHADEEREEFDYLVGEIATPANFDRVELQRFVALWCLGHVRDAVAG